MSRFSSILTLIGSFVVLAPTFAVAQSGPKDFIIKMTTAGLAEVKLGDLAALKAANLDVKAFGEQMMKDHSAANAELIAIASGMRIEAPTDLDKKHRDVLDRLQHLQAPEFDREYLNAMIESHKEVARSLREFAGASTSPGPAPELRPNTPVGTSGRSLDGDPLVRWAERALPTVEQHLQRAQQILQTLK